MEMIIFLICIIGGLLVIWLDLTARAAARAPSTYDTGLTAMGILMVLIGAVGTGVTYLFS